MAPKLGQQANACKVAVRVLSGVAAPSKREKEFLAECVRAAGVTLRWLEMHEPAVRKAVARAGGGDA